MKSLARDLIFIKEDNTIYGITGDDDEITKAKFKNIVMPDFWPKVGFLTLIENTNPLFGMSYLDQNWFIGLCY